MLTDGKSANHCGLYNPWWDAVMLFEASGLSEVPKVEKFAFVSGARFRGETGKDADNLAGVVPQAMPLAVELWGPRNSSKPPTTKNGMLYGYIDGSPVKNTVSPKRTTAPPTTAARIFKIFLAMSVTSVSVLDTLKISGGTGRPRK